MACTSCSTSDGGSPKGCKNNGTCGTDSCNKLTVFDWLSNMLTWTSAFWLCWSSFQKRKKRVLSQYWKINAEYGRHCATVASPGHDIVTLTGGGKIKWRKKEQILTVTRFLKSTEKHHRRHWHLVCTGKEEPMKVRARELAISQNWKWKYLILNFKEMDLKHVLLHGKWPNWF
jgi:hypothetical protein